MKKKKFIVIAAIAAVSAICLTGFIMEKYSKEHDPYYDYDAEEYTVYKWNVTKESLGIDETYENAEELYKRLSDRQKECIAKTLSCDEDEVLDNLKEYSEAYINSLIYGYGCGLYKQNAGIEKNGLIYYIDKKDNSLYYDNLMEQTKHIKKKITYEEAYKIREKEEKLRLDDFFKYKHIVHYDEDKEGNVYREVFFPVEEYEGLYVNVRYYEYEDGKIEIVELGFLYTESDETPPSYVGEHSDCTGFYEGKVRRQEIFDKECNKKYYAEINYTSNTKRTLDIQIYNLTDDDLEVYPSYEIYKKEGGKLEKLEDYCYKASDEDMFLVGYAHCDYDITTFLYFAIGKDDLKEGEYTIKYGEKDRGDVYCEMDFTVD